MQTLRIAISCSKSTVTRTAAQAERILPDDVVIKRVSEKTINFTR
jgi:hypothetical protein